MSTRIRCARILLGASLLAEIATMSLGLNGSWLNKTMKTELVSVPLFVLALIGLAGSGLALRRALFVVIGAGVLLQCATLTSAPSTSDDFQRYIWDAKVQFAGIDPYRYPPDAAQLQQLQHGTLFDHQFPTCVWKLTDGRCTKINRPDVRTIYPPVAEAAFDLIRLGSLGRDEGPRPVQLGGAIGVTALGLLLAWRARRQQLAAWTVALWTWCPVTLVELTANAHIDWLAALLSVGALMAAGARAGPTTADPGRRWWSAARWRGSGWPSGVLFGAAVVTKLYPGLLLPVLIRRRGLRVVVGAIGLSALAYLPHVIAVGAKVIGFLPSYLKQENYTSGTRFMLLSGAFLHEQRWLTAIAVVVLAAGAVIALWRTDPDHPELTGVWLIGLALLVTTPSYAWYAVLLLALVAMTARIEWLPLAVMPSFAMTGAQYFGDAITYRRSCYGVGLACAVLGSLLRWWLRSRASNATPPGPAEAVSAASVPGPPSRP